MLALGYGKKLFSIEVIKDLAIAVAILSTVWFDSVELLVWGQLWASIATFIIIFAMVCKTTGYSMKKMAGDILPFVGVTLLMCVACWLTNKLYLSPILLLLLETTIGAIVYLTVMKIQRAPELPEALQYIFGKIQRL